MLNSQTESLSTTEQTAQTQGHMSHKKYEKQFRRLNNGAKRYEPCVPPGMVAKRAARLAKKQAITELPTPITTVTKPTVSADVVVVNRYANTPVVYKLSHGKLIVLVFLDGDNPKHSTVYNIKDDAATFCKKGSRAQKYTDEEFMKYGWKTSTLGDDDFAPILALLMETEAESAAA